MSVEEKDTRWNAIRRALAKSVEFVDIGLIGDGATQDHEGLTNAEIGTIHEFGAPSAGIPQRSFIRATVDDQKKEHGMLIAELAERVLSLKMTKAQALGLLGERVKADVQNRIKRGIAPPLQPSTIIAKGGKKTTPLINTGQMVNAISYRVG